MGLNQGNYKRIADIANSHGSIKGGIGEYIEDFSEFIEKRHMVTFTSEQDGGGGLGLHIGIAADADPANNYGTPHQVKIGHTAKVATIRVLSGVVRVLVESGSSFVSPLDTLRLEVGAVTLILTKTTSDRYEATEVATEITTAFADGNTVTCFLSDVVFA